MRRLSLWMRAHPVFGDSLIAGLLFVPDLLTIGSDMGYTSRSVYFLVGLMLSVPMAFRRARPKLMCHLVLLGAFVQLFSQVPTYTEYRLPIGPLVRPADLALGVALYTMVAYVGRKQSTIYAMWLAVGTLAWEIWRVRDPLAVFFSLLMIVMIFAFCWAMGEFVGARRAYHNEVMARLKLLETERGQQARIAVAEERTRIARELHDVVAHAVSVMVVQADGAGYALHTDPRMAQLALTAISDTGRQALAELRRLLGLMRAEDDTNPQRHPQPDTATIPALADQIRAAGLAVHLTMRGELDNLPAGVGLSVYRIVQEALTNSLKHAGGSATATVRIDRADDHIEVEIADDGFGTPRELAGVSGGNGLVGMRERAGVLGGSLDAGPRPGGGWRVKAVLPIGAAPEPLL